MAAMPAAALLAFLGGIAVVVAATERLVDALFGIAIALELAPFAVSAVLSGMEAENVAVGLAAGARHASDIALGTAYGGAIVLLCWALGVGALVAPLRVRLPPATVLLMPAAALLAGLPLGFASTPRWSGLVLLAAFVCAFALLLRHSREGAVRLDEPDANGGGAPRTAGRIVGWTVAGLLLVAAGGELVAWGADGLVHTLHLSAGFVGMVVTHLGIEAEEIARQVVPARRGRPDISAGNAIGTVVWFLLFNLALIALVTPVEVPARTRLFDWPVLVLAAVIASAFLLRGRMGRLGGAVLVAVGLCYAALQLIVR